MKQDKNIEKSMFLYPVNLVNPRRTSVGQAVKKLFPIKSKETDI